MSKVTVDNLAKAIQTELKKYEGATEEAVEKGLNATADDAVKELRNAHPSGSGKYGSWDKYKIYINLIQSILCKSVIVLIVIILVF